LLQQTELKEYLLTFFFKRRKEGRKRKEGKERKKQLVGIQWRLYKLMQGLAVVSLKSQIVNILGFVGTNQIYR
jgi:hypothetical protein